MAVQLFKLNNLRIQISTISIFIFTILWTQCQCDVPLSSFGYVNQTVKAVLEDIAKLRCNTSPPLNDNVTLILWYHETSLKPFFSVDKRSQGTPSFRSEPKWNSSTSFNLAESRDFSILTLKPVKRWQQGLYRCRIDFKRSPTRDYIVNVSLIVPPAKLEIFDDKGVEVGNGHVGPYRENSTVVLTCLASGGVPPPRVNWWQGSSLLDDTSRVQSDESVKNEFKIEKLTRDHLYSVYVCQATNNNISVENKKITINMTLAPQSVKLQGADQAMSAGRSYELSCLVYGANPSPVIKWSKGSDKLKNFEKSDKNDGNLTISTLTFIPDPLDDGKTLSCLVESPVAATGQFSDSRKLIVQYKPIAVAILGETLNSSAISEGNDVYFECKVKTNTQLKKTLWKRDGNILHSNHNAGILFSSNTLILQKVSRQQSGLYSCLAVNEEGEAESNSTYLDVKYAPVCFLGSGKEYGADRGEKVRVKCEVEANPATVTFGWQFSGKSGTVDLAPDRFITNGTKSLIQFQPSSENDYGKLYCKARNSLGEQATPCIFNIYPAGKPDPVSNCTVINKMYTSFRISCTAGFDGGSEQLFIAEVYERDFQILRHNFTSDSPEFVPSELKSGVTYNIVLYAYNSKGRSATIEFTETTIQAPIEAVMHFSTPVALPPLLTILTILVGVLIILSCCIVIIIRSQDNRRRKKNYSYKSKESLEKNPDIIPNKDDGGDTFEIVNVTDKQIPSKQTDISLILQNSYGTDMNSDFILHQEDYKNRIYRKKTSSVRKLNECEITYASCDQPCPPFVTQETPLLSATKVPFVTTEGQHAVPCCIHGLSRSTSIS